MKKSNLVKKIASGKNTLVPFIGLITVIIVLQLMSGGNLLVSRTFNTIINEVFILMMGSFGLVFVMSQGNLDLSIAANMAVSSAVAVKAASISPILALPVGIAVGLTIGLLNGLIHTKGHIDSFITTIGVQFMLSGFVVVLLGNVGSVGAPIVMTTWDNIPLRVITLVIFAILGYMVFEFGKYGKYCKAIGANEMAARQSGVPVDRVKIISFLITGGIGGLLSFFSLIRTGTASAQSAGGFMFNILIAILIGGLPITGGPTSRFRAAIIGSMTMAFLSVGMTVNGIDTTLQQLIKGLIFIFVVFITFDKKGIALIK